MHRGLVHYTVGQAARVGGTGKRLYVAEKDVDRNTLLVVSDQKKLNKTEIAIEQGAVASSVSDYVQRGVQVFCSIRSVDKTGVEVRDLSDGLVRLKGEVYAPCAGQWAVFYAEDGNAAIQGRLCL